MIGPALDDDCVRTDHRLRSVFKFQLDLTLQNNAVVNAVGSVHRRLSARHKVDDPDDRSLVEGQPRVTRAPIRFVVVVRRNRRCRPYQCKLRVAASYRRGSKILIRLDDRAAGIVVAGDDPPDWRERVRAHPFVTFCSIGPKRRASSKLRASIRTRLPKDRKGVLGSP